MIGAKPPGHHRFVSHARHALEEPTLSGIAGAEERFRGLVGEHFDFIWRQLRRMGLSSADADDASQQVFMIAAQKLESIAVGSERSFLYGAALRVAANARRASRRARDNEAATERASFPAAVPEPDRRVELRRAWNLLDELLAELPEELARVLVLVEIEELGVAEVASLERIPTGTAASRLRRAREKFNALLAEQSHRNPFGGGSQ
ncbi:MAG TPA: sigma-70 family RNA polymerase sigma factor [Polyangiaceae bacterium]|nr:sigma-70 family RNA polymerase sigma factor [Polyangiaceae bacterium]